jgi:hypothetical protein
MPGQFSLQQGIRDCSTVIATKGRSARGPLRWTARAANSFPVPLSPSMSTLDSVGATRLALKFVDLHLYFQRPSTASYPSESIYEVVLAYALVVSVPEVNRLQFLQQFF